MAAAAQHSPASSHSARLLGWWPGQRDARSTEPASAADEETRARRPAMTAVDSVVTRARTRSSKAPVLDLVCLEARRLLARRLVRGGCCAVWCLALAVVLVPRGPAPRTDLNMRESLPLMPAIRSRRGDALSGWASSRRVS